MKKLIIIVCKGLPSSGKSTWAKKFVEEKENEWIRINRDDIRHMLGKYWVPNRENLVTEIEKKSVDLSLKQGYNVVLDSTNLNSKVDKWIQNLVQQFKFKGIEIIKEVKDFTNVSMDECIKRDNARTEGKVGEEIIRNMAKKYFPDKYRETKNFIPMDQDENLPKTIICDLDGTLANNSWRSPFKYDECDKDKCYEHIAEIVRKFSTDHKILLLSGREATGRKSTLKFLKNNKIPFDELIMRKAGDMRKDAIVKRELFETFIKGKYNVKFVLDDRPVVIRMWKWELGLYVLNVQGTCEEF